MRVGILADIHDNVDNLRHAIGLFNALECGAILLAGDFVSPLVVPSMRRFTCPVIACFGDNDGNQIGIAGGMKIVGTLGYPPFCWQSRDGVKFLLAHQQEDVKGLVDGSDVIVFAHTHRPSIATDRHGRVFINPGEVGGWVYRRPTVAVFDTDTRTAEIMDLPPMPPAVLLEER